MNNSPIQEELSEQDLSLLKAVAKSARKSIMEMVINAQSGHPGGSLSCIDYLTLLYTKIISQNGEKIVVSNGHISPGVYSILAEMGYISKEEVVKTFRKINSPFEGHVTRHVPGVWYGTGPLGVGVSVGASLALGAQLHGTNEKVFALAGDGECQEGQVHEMIQFAKNHKLNNLILFIDYNKVQLTASLKEIQDIDLVKIFEAGDFEVIEVDGHDFKAMWQALQKAYASKDKPVVILGHTIMGKGIEFMEPEGENHKATWHGKAPKAEQAEESLNAINLTTEEQKLIEDFRTTIKWKPTEFHPTPSLQKVEINQGTPLRYEADELTDCRSAYGKALLDLAHKNPQIVALTADLKGSVMTQGVSDELPAQYIECGIAEQNMVSVAGGLSIDNFIPFASTFGAFMSSRAKDQARVNDINQTNVKMVATHCGLSVGEDGPTHQAIDDTGSFLGMFNTMVIEPADPNHTDRIIRYIASHYGNFYVRMGRHKFPTITKEDGSIFYDENYQYQYGKCDLIREGSNITIAATGATISEALKAREILKTEKPELSVEIIAVSSIKHFDETVINSIKKTKKVITVEDHNTLSGLGGQLARHLATNGIQTESYKMIGVEQYELSGTAPELYAKAKIDGRAIADLAKMC